MPQNVTRKVPIAEIRRDTIGEDLASSEAMKPYMAYWVAEASGKDTRPALDQIKALPLEGRYLWRVVSALKWAFADFDHETIRIDLRTLSQEDLRRACGDIPLRTLQFCKFLEAMIGRDAMRKMVLDTIGEKEGE